jgi:hypothetical protein
MRVELQGNVSNLVGSYMLVLWKLSIRTSVEKSVIVTDFHGLPQPFQANLRIVPRIGALPFDIIL